MCIRDRAFTCYPDALLLQCEIEPEIVMFAIRMAHRQQIPVFFDMAPVRDDLDISFIGKCEVISPNESETEFYTGISTESSDGCLREMLIRDRDMPTPRREGLWLYQEETCR